MISPVILAGGKGVRLWPVSRETLPKPYVRATGSDATLLQALEALQESVARLPHDRQPHRAVLVRNRRGEIIGKVHHFAFLRALVPERKSMGSLSIMERAGVGDDLRESSMKMLDLLTGDLVDICEMARNALVRDVYTSATVSIQEDAPLSDAIAILLYAFRGGTPPPEPGPTACGPAVGG